MLVAAALYGAAVVLGYVELALLAAAVILALVFGLAFVLRRPSLEVRRHLEPARITRGELGFVTLSIANRSRFNSGGLVAAEPCGPTRIEIDVPRLKAGTSVSKRYRLPTEHRAVLQIGPVEVVQADPFALWQRVQRSGDVQQAWVHPVVHGLAGLPPGRTRSLEGSATDNVPHGSITFHNLRDYVIGDDMRLIHWRSSARTGTLMVKENVDTSLPRITVLLDTRTSVHTPESFESAVEAAASVVVAATMAKYPVRLVTTAGRSVGGRGLSADARQFLDVLSEVSLEAAPDLRRAIGSLVAEKRSDALVTITGASTADDLAVIGALGRRYDDAVVAVVTEHPDDVAVPVGLSGVVVRGDSGETFARRWNQVLSR